MLQIAKVMVVLILVLSALARAQDAAQINAELQARLLEMGRADQEVRQRIKPFYGRTLETGSQSEEFKTAVAELQATDRKNFLALDEITKTYGWPGVAAVGTDASNAAFLILQHSTLEHQKELLPKFRQAVADRQARTADLAMLEDRILVGDGKNQIYGTQIAAGSDGHFRVQTVEDPANLDARRKSVGLPTMDEYLKRVESELGVPVLRGNLDIK